MFVLLRVLSFLQCSCNKTVLNTIFKNKSALEIGKQQWRILSYHWKLGREGGRCSEFQPAKQT